MKGLCMQGPFFFVKDELLMKYNKKNSIKINC